MQFSPKSISLPFNVSRETYEKLELYYNLLKKWNGQYNLVNEKTINESVIRHFYDSLQIIPLIDTKKTLLDMGSGAGFPGLVLAIAGCQNVTLVDSNKKKCEFLNEVARQTNVKVEIFPRRVEDISGQFEQFTARAFTKLEDLIKNMKTVSRETNSVGIFLKGESCQSEIENALNSRYNFSYEKINSLTNNNSTIIKIWNIEEK